MYWAIFGPSGVIWSIDKLILNRAWKYSLWEPVSSDIFIKATSESVEAISKRFRELLPNFSLSHFNCKNKHWIFWALPGVNLDNFLRARLQAKIWVDISLT